MASGEAFSSRRGPGRGKRLPSRPPRPPTPPSDHDPSDSEEAAPDLHPWLQFEYQPYDERLLVHQPRRFFRSRTISWPVLEEIHLAERARLVLPDPWQRLFSISEPAYTELTLEFLSTVHLQSPLARLDYDRAFTFRLGGVDRHISITSFALRMGLYLPAEIDTPLFTEGLFDFPEGVTPATYWPEIGEGAFNPQTTKSTKIRDPLVRVLHRAIAHSVCGRSDSNGVVTNYDMFPLYCLTAPATCNVAYCLASCLSRASIRKPLGPICIGSYVTLLARSFGILTPEVTSGLTKAPSPTPIDIRCLSHMGVIREQEDGGGYELLDGHGRVWQPAQPGPQAQHVEVVPGDDADAGAGRGGGFGRGRGRRRDGGDDGVGIGRGDGGRGRGGDEQGFVRYLTLSQFRRYEQQQARAMRRQERRIQWQSQLLSAMAAAQGIEIPPPPQDSDDE